MPSPPFALHNTMGALFIGVMVANSLLGLSFVQAFYYYRNQNDKWPIKLLVAAVMISDTIHQGLITHTVYIYLISNWGDVEELGYTVPSLVIEIFFNALTALLVQSFLNVRVWKLSNGNILLTGLLAVFILAEFASAIAFGILDLQFDTFLQMRVLKPLSLAVNVLAAVGDVLIAGTLCFLLHRFRTEAQISDSVINKLMLFALNTGLLTSVFATASFVTYIAAPNALIYITFYFCIGRLYNNSLLAFLNARKMIRGSTDVPLSSFKVSTGGTTSRFSSFQQQRTISMANIPIKMDTTREYVMENRRQDHDGGKLEYSQTSSSNVVVGFEIKSLGV